MRYISVCAGIEAATVAWHPLGWEPVLFAEIESFPCAVLKHHYPDVPLVGDFTQLILDPPHANLLVGGTPCQAFSVAGKRLSLEDYRGNLSLAFADLFHAGEYEWAVWENVPGVLSTRDNAFGCLLARLVGADAPLLPGRGQRWTNAGVVSGPLAVAAWRVLDAQYFGVAQRRRRVFVCVSRGAGNWAAAAALLPVGESVSGHPPARRQAGEGTAGTFEIGPGGGKPSGVSATLDSKAKDGPRRNQQSTAIVDGGTWWDGHDTAQTLSTRSNDQRMPDRGNCGGDHHATVTSKWAKGSGGPAGAETGNLVVEGGGWPAAIAPTLNAAFAEKQGLEDQHINGGAGMFVLDKQGGQVTEGISPTLKTDLSHQMGPVVAVPQDLRNREGKAGGGKGPLISADQSLTLATANDQVVFASVVAPTLSASNDPSRSPQSSEVTMQVAAVVEAIPQLRPRRLTEKECARLQGFPDLYLVTDYANADEAHAAQILRQLWREAGAPPAQEQGGRIGSLAALLTAEVLLAGVYGGWLSWAMADRYATAQWQGQSPNAYTEGVVRGLRQAGQARHSPYQRESYGQLADELGCPLSELPLEEAQIAQVLRDSGLWGEAQRTWPLRQTPSAKAPGKMNPAGPRYKALGNSMAVPVMRWIGKRIQLMEDTNARQDP